MNKFLYVVIQRLFSIISIISTIVALFLIGDQVISILVWGTVFVSLVIIIIASLKLQAHDNAIDSLAKAYQLDHTKKREVKLIETEAELRDVWGKESIIYGDDCPNWDIFSGWWKKYKAGLYGLFEENEVIGVIGIWPLKRKPFDELVNGKRREKEIKPASIHGTYELGDFHDWYISGISLQTRFRRTDAIKQLVIDSLALWLKTGQIKTPLRLSAMAYSKDGETLLKRFGFRLYTEKTLDGWPVYLWEINDFSDLKRIETRLHLESNSKKNNMAKR